jgi:sRNA-binding carbon storage regulator CsrA
MLILTRHPGQLNTLQPHPSLRPATPIGRLFAEGPIEILVARICGQRVSLGITAHAGLLIYRNEVGEEVGVKGRG